MNEILYALKHYFRLYEMGYITEGYSYEICKEIERSMEAISIEQEQILRELYIDRRQDLKGICKTIGLSRSGLYRARKQALYIMCAIMNKEIK